MLIQDTPTDDAIVVSEPQLEQLHFAFCELDRRGGKWGTRGHLEPVGIAAGGELCEGRLAASLRQLRRLIAEVGAKRDPHARKRPIAGVPDHDDQAAQFRLAAGRSCGRLGEYRLCIARGR